MQIKEGATYRINFEGMVTLEATVFRVYEEVGRQFVEWGITGTLIVETADKFLEHVKAA